MQLLLQKVLKMHQRVLNEMTYEDDYRDMIKRLMLMLMIYEDHAMKIKKEQSGIDIQ